MAVNLDKKISIHQPNISQYRNGIKKPPFNVRHVKLHAADLVQQVYGLNLYVDKQLIGRVKFERGMNPDAYIELDESVTLEVVGIATPVRTAASKETGGCSSCGKKK